jgi:L-lactate dehydrogenase (cytochrome)
MTAISTQDFRDAARRRLPRFLFEYVDGGAYAEVTLRRNVADLADVALKQRVLRDVASIDLTTTLFGRPWAMPIALAPVGLAGLLARRGEVQAARAAEAAGVPFCLSTMSACPVAEVSGAVRGPIWFQLYMVRDRGFVAALLEQAAAQRCDTLVFTVDLPMPGRRYRDYRSGLAGEQTRVNILRRFGQALMRPAWAWDVGVRGRPLTLGNLSPLLGSETGLEDYFGWIRTQFDASVTWKDFEWIRARWRGPIVVKGILDAGDARDAAAAGAQGLVVSNHGGRQLDGVLSSARALPAIADAVGDRLTVLADGGVRSGLDVVRMLGLGARAVLLGRAWAYALGASGEAGVRQLLQLMDAEMRIAMALTGTTRVSAIDEGVLAGKP